MSIYTTGHIPAEYNQAIMQEELDKIFLALSNLEVPFAIVSILGVAPTKVLDGMIAYANGTDWDPGHGKGLYQYQTTDTEWLPLFPLSAGTKTSSTQVVNTTTETEIYSVVIPAGGLHAGEMFEVIAAGPYSTGAASDTFTLRVKLNGTTLQTLTRQSTNNVTDAGWRIQLAATIRTEGVTGTLIDNAVFSDDNAVITTSDPTVHVMDTTVSRTLSITVQWAVAKVTNDFRCDVGRLDYHH